MKTLIAVLAIVLAGTVPALAFDDATQDVTARYKSGKPMAITDVAVLMQASERWCYLEDAASCAWSDIYLEVTGEGVQYEIANAWDEAVNITFTDQGVFEDNRYICETKRDWLPTLGATSRSDGAVIGGRQLWALKAELAEIRSTVIDCFDYLYLGADPAAQTITLLQRQYTDETYDPGQDTEVTLHFDAKGAQALTLRW